MNERKRMRKLLSNVFIKVNNEKVSKQIEHYIWETSLLEIERRGKRKLLTRSVSGKIVGVRGHQALQGERFSQGRKIVGLKGHKVVQTEQFSQGRQFSELRGHQALQGEKFSQGRKSIGLRVQGEIL
jgi:hypothetical protein